MVDLGVNRRCLLGLLAVAAFAAAAGGGARAGSFPGHPGCSWPPQSRINAGTELAKYLVPDGCAYLAAPTRVTRPFLPYYGLTVRWKGQASTFEFPWPAFSKVVAGACKHGDYAKGYANAQWFLVQWPFVTYSIPLCADDGTPVELATLGGTNRATGLFKVLRRTSGKPYRLAAVAIPPPFTG